MTRTMPIILIFGLLFAAKKQSRTKTEFTVTGTVIGVSGDGLSKVKLTIFDDKNERIKKGKTKGDGSFKFRKVLSGNYIIKGEHKDEGEIELDFTIERKDVDLMLEYISDAKNLDGLIINDETSKPIDTKVLNTFESKQDVDKTTDQMIKLPQQRERSSIDKLEFDNLFFEYEANLEALKVEIDSLKNVVRGYEKGQRIPNVGREILDLIKIPENQHRIELQNGTVVSGELLQESDSTLILDTQIGKLVLKKEIVVRMDELEKPGPKVIFIGEPFIDYYPDKQIFSGKVKNVGEIRADFVRVVGSLFDQTTKAAGRDSIFVKGSKINYESRVVADTALEPEQTASYTLTVQITKGVKAQYHTMDIHWEQTK